MIDKQKLNIIIRGFIYRENWTPISVRKKIIQNYTIDFFKCCNGYIDLIDKLQKKYDLDLYFTTYDTTPLSVLNNIRKQFNPKDIFISKELNSSQFTTTTTALKNLLANTISKNILSLIIRSDIIIEKKLIDTIYNSSFNEDKLYVLTKEKNRDRVIDIIHVVPASRLEQFVEYIQIPNLLHAHNIHKKIKCKVMSTYNNCKNTDGCTEFYRIYY